jgi:hypothetical protein
MDTSNAFGVFSPPGSKTHPQFIRFVDSGYRELFKIPDGANIRITYPPGDGRETGVRACYYIDDHHFRTDSETFHVAEFAERMEAGGARYEPEILLRGAEIVPIAPGEEKYCTYNREEGNTCVGHITGDFGVNGDRFRDSWYNRTTRSEGDWTTGTPEFRAELHSAVYALRRSLLKDHESMRAFCQSRPEAKLPTGDGLEHYGFKLETETRRYFVRCRAEETSRDSRFVIYAYDDKPVPDRDRPDLMTVRPGTDDDRLFFYRNDAESSRCVGVMRGDFGKGGDEFWHNWSDGDAGRNTPEFKAEFEKVVDLLRRGVLKDLRSSRDFCSRRPEARLAGDVHRYGFKLETATRQYFVRCTTLNTDYFYIFAYDKPAPDRDREKPSVLNRIRDAQKAPRPPRKAKSPDKKKDGAEL